MPHVLIHDLKEDVLLNPEPPQIGWHKELQSARDTVAFLLKAARQSGHRVSVMGGYRDFGEWVVRRPCGHTGNDLLIVLNPSSETLRYHNKRREELVKGKKS